MTNRESGLSALASALTGWAPKWGLHLESNRKPNFLVNVEAEMSNLTDWSILGDWIGKQIMPTWELPWGPMPRFVGLPRASFEMQKALTASVGSLYLLSSHNAAPLVRISPRSTPRTPQEHPRAHQEHPVAPRSTREHPGALEPV